MGVVRGLEIGIALIQVLDIVIHAATNQLELLRVTSNVVVLVWVAAEAAGRIGAGMRRTVALLSIGAYVALNGVFVALNGVTNPEQGGEVRGVLFLLVFLTVAASILLVYLLDKQGVGSDMV